MAFKVKPLRSAGSGILGWCARRSRDILLFTTRAVLTIATLCLIAAALFYARLMQGPLELPLLGRLAAEQLKATESGHGVEIGGIVVDLAGHDMLTAFRFVDVTVNGPGGEALVNLPEVGAQLGFSDLFHGRVAPQRIMVQAPDVVLTRGTDGTLHMKVGSGAGVPLATGATASDAGNPLERALAQFVGEESGADFLADLRSVRIDGARLIYEDEVLQRSWESQGARLELVRFDGGARAALQADLIELPGRGAAVRLVAERFKGQQDLHLTASFGQITPSVVAAQMPGLEWLSVLEGSIEGRATAIVGPDGQVRALGGTIFSEQGRLSGWGPDGTFDTAEINFLMDPARETIRVDKAVLSAEALDTAMYGIARIERDDAGDMAGLSGELTVERIYANLPELFAAPIAFDAGQLAFDWRLDENVIEVSESTLRSGDLAFRLSGSATETGKGWDTTFNAEATGMDIEGLLAHWPLATAGTARDWVAEHISAADIPEFKAKIRLGRGEPELALDFRFRNMNSTYLDDMSPIRSAAGRGRMTYHDLFLDFARARVQPRGHAPIALGGSTVAIRDFWGNVTPADIRLNASGETKAILALIDQQPLGLVSKLGIDLGRLGGTADVVTDVTFPLIADLRLDQVEASAEATLRRLTLQMDLGGQGTAAIAGDNLKLQADTKAMGLSGRVDIDGVRTQLAWRETYSGRDQGRTIKLEGQTSDRLLAMLGAGDLPLSGAAPFALDLAQKGDGPVAFDLDMDLKPAVLEIAELGWRKGEGRKGRLRARGNAGKAVKVDSFALNAAGLVAEGALDLTEGGTLGQARFDRLVVPGLADVRGRAQTASDGVLEVTLTGGQVDLSQQLDGATDAPDDSNGDAGDPIRLAFTLDRMLLTENIVLSDARGKFARTAAGALGGDIQGNLGRNVPIALQLTRPPQGGGRIELSSPDAGAALEAADLYRGARGGRLVVNADIGRGRAADLSGTARIEGINVRSERTFRRVLRSGGFNEAEQQVQNSGLGFRKIWIPFVYDEGVLTLTDAIATSPVLALKVNGTLDEATEALDLSGVMSPAYALTGALNEIPVLGTLLSGGEGEGILAMTFTLSGPARDPDLSVNPLSILAPGFLRNIFRRDSGQGGTGQRDREQRELRSDRVRDR